MANQFPGGANNFPRPDETKKLGSPGYYLDEILNDQSDAIEADEAKIGFSESSAQDTPLADTGLLSDTNGKSKWQKAQTRHIATGGQIGKRQLDYVNASTLWNGLAISSTTWTDVNSNQTFTVDESNSVVEIDVSGQILVTQASGSGHFCASRLVIDSAGTPQNRPHGGMFIASSGYGNPLAGGASHKITNLAAGSHTVKIQVYVGTAATGYLRTASIPNTEFLQIQVTEIKR